MSDRLADLLRQVATDGDRDLELYERRRADLERRPVLERRVGGRRADPDDWADYWQDPVVPQ